MGTSNSRFEEDKALQLCRDRKKFIKQALNGRCSLAAAHIVYTEELRIIGAALSRFVLPDGPVKACLAEKPVDPSHVDAAGSTPSYPSCSQLNAMKVGGIVSAKVEEKPAMPVMVSVASMEAPEALSLETPPWDYFSLFNPTDQMENDHRYDSSDETRRLREEEGMPELEDAEGSQVSEDEFEEPSSASLVRSFRNVNAKVENVASETRHSDSDEVKEAKDTIDPSPEHAISEAKSVERKNKAESPRSSHLKDAIIAVIRESEVEDIILPKDFFSSISDIEQLFVQASESGREVPQMLEATRFHSNPAAERGSIGSSLLKSCFSCWKDPGLIRQELLQDSAQYVTWHRMRSSHSSQNPPLTSSTEGADNPKNNLFDHFCMVSGSHASTLDRIYAWEKKLYSEVKAAQVLKTNFDQKCKLLRQKESRGENAEKKRAAVKDLHSRMQVAIHRINSISKKIEEIRDMELQPQLEELIQGLRTMWEMMARCHRLQLHIISASSIPKTVQIKLHLDPQGQMTNLHLSNELNSLPSAFTKWIATQKAYIESLDKWLFKCVTLPQNPTRRNRRMKPLPLRNWGPPIYMICGAWLEMIDGLPLEGVTNSVRALVTEVARFMPRHKGRDRSDETPDDHWAPPVEQFQTTLASLLQELKGFAECSVKMYGELQIVIQGAKSNYEQFKLQQQRARDSEGHVI